MLGQNYIVKVIFLPLYRESLVSCLEKALDEVDVLITSGRVFTRALVGVLHPIMPNIGTILH